MRYQVTAAGTAYDVRIKQNSDTCRITLNGREIALDFVECPGDVFSVLSGGESVEFSLDPKGDGDYTVQWRGHSIQTHVERGSPAAACLARTGTRSQSETAVETPMPGKVVAVLVQEGDKVEKGQGLVVVEAMKMENEFTSPCSGIVKRIDVAPGSKVESHSVLAIVKEER